MTGSSQPGPLAPGTPQTEASLDFSQPRAPFLRRLGGSEITWLALFLVVLLVAFSALAPDAFPTVFNVRNMAIDASTLVILGVGMTMVIASGGIDLSIGSVLVFSGVVAAQVMIATRDLPPVFSALLGVLAALASGFAWGLLNGVLIARLGLPALIVTLASLGAALGAAQLITGGVDLRDIPDLLAGFGRTDLFGLPWIVLTAIVISAIGAVFLDKSRFGVRTYAIGSNKVAANRVGIDVTRHTMMLYAIMGLLAGLAAVIQLSRFNSTSISGSTTVNLTVIAGVVLGGTSLFGGSGKILGSVIGILIPVVLTNGFVILGIQPFWQAIAVSAILVLAVYLDSVRRKRRER